MTLAVFVVLLIACACLLWFVIGIMQDIPASKGKEQCDDCHPPIMDPRYYTHVAWRCSRCGRKWKIHVDLDKSRRDYRQWMPQ